MRTEKQQEVNESFNKTLEMKIKNSKARENFGCYRISDLYEPHEIERVVEYLKIGVNDDYRYVYLHNNDDAVFNHHVQEIGFELKALAKTKMEMQKVFDKYCHLPRTSNFIPPEFRIIEGFIESLMENESGFVNNLTERGETGFNGQTDLYSFEVKIKAK